ncbi:MAG: GntR family transcriptional regulator [Flavobacteriales bacterium]|nr:GntR family transcriptional regulator [Flavobacteriales bacterium]
MDRREWRARYPSLWSLLNGTIVRAGDHRPPARRGARGIRRTDYLSLIVIRTGRTQNLIILRHTSEGLILGDDDAAEVLLPKAEQPKESKEGDALRVFVYRDREGQHSATTKLPKAQIGEFANMRVARIRGAGALVDWGVEPALLVPHEEQKKPMEEGRWYVVRVALDDETDQPYGSTRIDRFLDNSELTVAKGEKVDLLVFGSSDLGYSVIVNNAHHGLVHANEVFKPVSIGDRLTGYVKQVRPDSKLDIVLQPIGYRQYIDAHTALLAKRLEAKGMLPLTDKSSAEDIYTEFGISKKAFKKALGALYKERLVRIGEDGIVWAG